MRRVAPGAVRRVTAAALAGLLSVVGLPAQVPGGVTPRWPLKAVVPVHIDPAHAPFHGERLVGRAVDVWTTAAAGRVELRRVTSREAAAVLVRFAPSETDFGETVPLADPRTGLLVRAEVTLANDLHGDRLSQQVALYLTALHELGHALGLAHQPDFASIMYRFRSPADGERFFNRYRVRLKSAEAIGTPAATGLADSDIQALQALYDR